MRYQSLISHVTITQNPKTDTQQEYLTSLQREDLPLKYPYPQQQKI